jgi:hypothetical protein
MSTSTWSNPSVLAFAEGQDPLEAARAAGRALVDAALSHGAAGPPVDPFLVAELLGLRLHPSDDVRDAEIHAVDVPATSLRPPSPGGDAPLASMITSPVPLALTYNPSRPRGRLRFSLAHEIAHALFPDVHLAVRRRTAIGAIPPDQRDTHSLHDRDAYAGPSDRTDSSWELELLCNVIASELLVPVQAVEGLANTDIDIDFFMEVRRRWDVSTETLLRRIVETSDRPVLLLALSPPTQGSGTLRVEYVLSSGATAPEHHAVARGDRVPRGSVLGRLSAVGQTARGIVDLEGKVFEAQAVGVPGYPGSVLPRVLSLIVPHTAAEDARRAVEHRLGDLLELDPAGGPVVIAHVVNDAARVWGRRGFADSLARRFPFAAGSFRAWAVSSSEHLRLGNAHVSEQRYGDRSVFIVSLIAQEGYGPGSLTRLNIEALRSSLAVVAQVAEDAGATVLVPRLGAGQAGGRWDLIEKALADVVVSRGVRVIVHTLPASTAGRRG